MTQETTKRGLLFWSLLTVGVGIVLFFGSAIIAGIMEAQEQSQVETIATKLTPVSSLQEMILKGVRAKQNHPIECWYLAAIAFRLAEARDLKISKDFAVPLANDQHLVFELEKRGFNSLHVIGGLASKVYDSPLPPPSAFDAQLRACSGK